MFRPSFVRRQCLSTDGCVWGDAGRTFFLRPAHAVSEQTAPLQAFLVTVDAYVCLCEEMRVCAVFFMPSTCSGFARSQGPCRKSFIHSCTPRQCTSVFSGMLTCHSVSPQHKQLRSHLMVHALLLIPWVGICCSVGRPRVAVPQRVCCSRIIQPDFWHYGLMQLCWYL